MSIRWGLRALGGFFGDEAITLCARRNEGMAGRLGGSVDRECGPGMCQNYPRTLLENNVRMKRQKTRTRRASV